MATPVNFISGKSYQFTPSYPPGTLQQIDSTYVVAYDYRVSSPDPYGQRFQGPAYGFGFIPASSYNPFPTVTWGQAQNGLGAQADQLAVGRSPYPTFAHNGYSSSRSQNDSSLTPINLSIIGKPITTPNGKTFFFSPAGGSLSVVWCSNEYGLEGYYNPYGLASGLGMDVGNPDTTSEYLAIATLSSCYLVSTVNNSNIPPSNISTRPNSPDVDTYILVGGSKGVGIDGDNIIAWETTGSSGGGIGDGLHSVIVRTLANGDFEYLDVDGGWTTTPPSSIPQRDRFYGSGSYGGIVVRNGKLYVKARLWREVDDAPRAPGGYFDASNVSLYYSRYDASTGALEGRWDIRAKGIEDGFYWEEDNGGIRSGWSIDFDGHLWLPSTDEISTPSPGTPYNQIQYIHRKFRLW
jgi:hypothetical protein